MGLQPDHALAHRPVFSSKSFWFCRSSPICCRRHLSAFHFLWWVLHSIDDQQCGYGSSRSLRDQHIPVEGGCDPTHNPVLFAVGKFTKNVWTLLSGAGNPLSVYMNKYGIIIVCYVAFYWLAMYAVGRDSISQKWCAETPEGLKLFDDHVREPVYGFDTHPCTREEAIAIRRTRNNTAVEEVHEIHPDPATFEFFDALIGNPKVWYSRESNGQVRLFDHPGFDPSSKEQLLPISPQVVEELRGVRRVESAQRRQQSEHAATAERNERLTTEAQAAFDAHNYDVVIDKCSAVLSSSRSPQCAELRHDAGVERAHELVTEATTAVEHGQFDLAIRNGRRAVSLDPQNRRAAQIVQIASDLKGTPAAVN